jgi:hypothetical protein
MQEEWKSMEKDLKNDGKKRKIVPKWRPPKARKQPVPKLAVIGGTFNFLQLLIFRNHFD